VTAISAAIAAKRRPAEEVLGHIAVGGDAIVGLGNGEPKTVIDAIEANRPYIEETSRIVPRLHPGAAVTTFKNIVDRVVTEYGVAELRGSSIAERTRRLIDVAHPKFREGLHASAQECSYLQ
jgi:hypothetical protein